MKTSWIRSVNPQAELRLVCFPFAGGGSADFRSWRPHCPESIDLCPVILPGREDRITETAYTRMEDLVSDLADNLVPLLSQTRFVFFGYSMGSWIAYALTQELRRREHPLPEKLFVAARRAPHCIDPLPPLSVLPDGLLIAGIQERYQAIPQLLLDDPAALAVFLPGLRADFRILDSYVCSPDLPLPIPIHAFYGTEDPLTPTQDMEAWQDHTSSEFSLNGLPGGHFFLRNCRQDLIRIVLSLL